MLRDALLIAEQYPNADADVLADAEAAVLLEETDLAEGRLTETVSALLSDREKRRIMAENFGTFAKKNANNLIYNELKTLVNSKNL
jgi:UDP-N-acetylglucosamine:LPS N-acetylglucosamine transferase